MRIVSIVQGSIAHELDLKVGDELVGFEGVEECDFIDYQYYNAQEEFVMIMQIDSDWVEFEISKDSDEDLGMEFEDIVDIKQCRNKCLFCFIDQNPPNVRKSLHIKDDDYRMSVLSGNFISLTNLQPKDITRILTYGLSPLYVSVHSTDNEIRKRLLGNQKIKSIMPILQVFKEHDIVIHAQIVYCPTINDDYINTIKQLGTVVASTAIVPVGLTKYSNNGLQAVTKDIACKVIDDIQELQTQGYKVYCGDEFYFRAGRALPDYLSYGNFDQISNGVGIVRQFEREFDECLQDIDHLCGRHTIITGTLAGDLMSSVARQCNKKGADISVIVAKSIFFGGDVSCAGLVVGSDIVAACKGVDLSRQNKVIIPKTMLKEFEDIFLDDMTLAQVEQEIGHKITVCGVDGREMLKIINNFNDNL